MPRAIDPGQAAFTGALEAFRPMAYDDAQPNKTHWLANEPLKGKATWGFGETTGVSAADVRNGKLFTKAAAEAMLSKRLQAWADKVCVAVRTSVVADLNAGEWMALVDFAFNTGVDTGWDLWKVLNRRDFDGVPGELLKFVYATEAGRKLKVQGLVNRRVAEVARWHQVTRAA